MLSVPERILRLKKIRRYYAIKYDKCFLPENAFSKEFMTFVISTGELLLPELTACGIVFRTLDKLSVLAFIWGILRQQSIKSSCISKHYKTDHASRGQLDSAYQE